MRPTLTLVILSAMVTLGATRSAPVASTTLIAFQAAPTPSPEGERDMGATEIDLVKWGLTQGGLTLVLIVVLASYRRDFFRKQDAKHSEFDLLRDEKRLLAAVIEKNSDTMTKTLVAIAENTKATERLAQNVNNLAERRGSHRG